MARGQYLMLPRDALVKWLWALWKPEWKTYWDGRALHLPQTPDTTPDTTCLSHMGTVREETPHWTTFGYGQCPHLDGQCKEPDPYTGLQGKARTESIMQMAHERKLHIVGLQETRLKKLPKSDTERYYVFGGAASNGGHYGTQLWFSKTLAALDEKQSCFFDRNHFKILCQGERILSVRVWAPFFRAIVICAHAPHSQHDESVKQQWWKDLRSATPTKYKDWPHVLLTDANARVGEFPDHHVGAHQGDLQDSNGDHFMDYVMECNLWLPSTFETVHEGESGTWCHHNKELCSRGDYVALPLQWRLEFCHSAVRPDIDITMSKRDHQVVYAGFRWQGLTNSEAKQSVSWNYAKYDTTGLREFSKVLMEIIGELPLPAHFQFVIGPLMFSLLATQSGPLDEDVVWPASGYTQEKDNESCHLGACAKEKRDTERLLRLQRLQAEGFPACCFRSMERK